MSQPTGATTTLFGLALVFMLLAAGILLFVLGDTEPGNSLVSLAVGIIVGGGSVHLTK